MRAHRITCPIILAISSNLAMAGQVHFPYVISHTIAQESAIANVMLIHEDEIKEGSGYVFLPSFLENPSQALCATHPAYLSFVQIAKPNTPAVLEVQWICCDTSTIPISLGKLPLPTVQTPTDAAFATSLVSLLGNIPSCSPKPSFEIHTEGYSSYLQFKTLDAEIEKLSSDLVDVTLYALHPKIAVYHITAPQYPPISSETLLSLCKTAQTSCELIQSPEKHTVILRPRMAEGSRESRSE